MKKALIFFIIAVAVAMVLPSFADQVSKSITDNDKTKVQTGFNPRDFGGLNNTFNATEKASGVTTVTTLTSTQMDKLVATQNRLTALIKKIKKLKTKCTNIKSKGLLNALDQFEKQAIQLNSEISAFMQNPTANNIDGRINSFVQREEALEHKVMVKEQLLSKMSTKMSTKQIKDTNSKDNENSNVKEQKIVIKQNKDSKTKKDNKKKNKNQ